MPRTYLDRLSELNDFSIWMFTKQETDFDQAFRAAKLFDEIPDIQNTNIEEYFASNHSRYGITTNVHRSLVISQLYGLITKTPFFSRTGLYKRERTTEVFKVLSEHEIGSPKYNTIKTEQVLKLKIHAIIDSAGNNQDYNILPVVFIFQVLKKIKDEHGIDKLDIKLLYTYVMTASNYSELDEVVNWIVLGGTPYSNIRKYKDLSRVLTAIKDNINLFIVTRTTISINPIFENYFYDKFVRSYDIDEMHENLRSSIDYSQLLFFHQDFDVNLIDSVPSYQTQQAIKPKELSKPVPSIDGDDERDYIEIVDSIKEENINNKIAIGAHMIVPTAVIKGTHGRKYKINPILGKLAIIKADYKCEFNHLHETFISKRTGKNFMEGHHLIPVGFQIDVWNKYGVNIDCIENIISLCPNCHRAIHYGKQETKKILIESLYSVRKTSFRRMGINITLDEIIEMYKSSRQ